MKLQTRVPASYSGRPIDYSSKLLLLGSCFAEHIGSKFSYFQFPLLQNPLGILFQPMAIENLVTRAVTNTQFQPEDTFFLNEQWHSFEAHSSLSNPHKDQILAGLNNAIKDTRRQISESTHVFITLGTAWAYRHKENRQWVANCHKVPQSEFSKELLSVKEIKASLKRTLGLISEENKKVTFVLTISPVRHLKDGFVQNQRSKAHLVTAVQELIQSESQRGNLWYFPAFEIMLDELRDYRFYEADMLHPNQLAVDYIWERFKESWIAEYELDTMQEVDQIRKGLAHLPFNPDSEAHKRFVKSIQHKIAYLKKKYPFMDFENAIINN